MQHNSNGKQTPAPRRMIVLEPNAEPKVIGAWSVGEVRRMANLLIAWLDSIPLSAAPEAAGEQPEAQTEQA